MKETKNRIETAALSGPDDRIRKSARLKCSGCRDTEAEFMFKAHQAKARAKTASGEERDLLLKEAKMYEKLARSAKNNGAGADRTEYPEMDREVR